MPNLCIIPARALALNLTASALRVLCAISLHTDREGKGCWASQKTLCSEAGVSRTRFYEAVVALQGSGLITVTPKAGRPTEYGIVYDKPMAVPKTGRVQSRLAGRGCPTSGTGPPINAPFNDPTTGDRSRVFPQRPRHRTPYQANDGPKAVGETLSLVMEEFKLVAALPDASA